MNATNRFLSVIVLALLPFTAHAMEKKGDSDCSTNSVPTMASTPDARLVIERWRLQAWRQSQTNSLYRVHTHESKALGDEKVYTFAHVRVSGLTNCTVSGFVAIQKPRDLREGWEDKLGAGVVLTIWRTR